MNLLTPTQSRVHAGQGAPLAPVAPTRNFVRAIVVDCPQAGVVREDIPFAEPAYAATAHGEMAWANECGASKETNQDAQVIDALREGFAVVDGMGGTHDGRLAASIMAEEIQFRLFRDGRRIAEAHEAAWDRIRTEVTGRFGKRNGVTERRIAASPALAHALGVELDSGATYAAVRVYGGKLYAWVAGDPRVVVIRRGKAAWSTAHGREGEFDPKPYRRFREWPAGGVSGSLDPREFRPLVAAPWALEPGDRVVVASDGLWDNLADERTVLPGCSDFDRFATARAKAQNAQLARAVAGLGVREAVRTLKKYQDAPHGDNMSVVVFDWKGGRDS